MHASLVELLEQLRPGLLWVSRDGMVRYANADASSRTGLAPGRKLYDPDLSRAVSVTVDGKAPRAVTAMGAPSKQGGAIPELNCRVIPGFTAEDAFVLIGQDAGNDRQEAFDSLMLVIRSDLAEPLAKAQSALLTARNTGDLHAVDALTSQLDDLMQILRKLHELASVWGSSTLLANDRIELWQLLKDVWAEVEPVAVERGLKVRFRAHGTSDRQTALYGSQPWLKRVFLECMEAALRHAKGGDTIEVEHRQLGPRALVVFRDCGAFAPVTHDAVDMPSAPRGRPGAAAKPRLAARDQIGLNLCRHIVSLHGGQLREEREDGLRHFLIDLPTGAPHRDDHSQLDIAQAQQYARDLAALMARSRSRQTPAA